MGTELEAYLGRLRGCAALMGRELAEITDRQRSVRLVESDAESVAAGFAAGQLAVERADRLRTLDPLQGTSRLVEGDPAEPRWEALPQMAAYVDLLTRYRYPAAAVRFATSAAELGLDLAVVAEDGRVLVLGAVAAEPVQLATLEALVSTYEHDPGWPVRRSTARDAQRLAHQLCATRAPYLWLVASGVRRAHRVGYGRTITLTRVCDLPAAPRLWPSGFSAPTPRILVREPVAGHQ